MLSGEGSMGPSKYAVPNYCTPGYPGLLLGETNLGYLGEYEWARLGAIFIQISPNLLNVIFDVQSFTCSLIANLKLLLEM